MRKYTNKALLREFKKRFSPAQQQILNSMSDDAISIMVENNPEYEGIMKEVMKVTPGVQLSAPKENKNLPSTETALNFTMRDETPQETAERIDRTEREADPDKYLRTHYSDIDDWDDDSKSNAGPSIVDTFTGSKLFQLMYPGATNKFLQDPEHNPMPNSDWGFNWKYMFSNKETRRQMADAKFANEQAKISTEKFWKPDHKIDESRTTLKEIQGRNNESLKTVQNVINDPLKGLNMNSTLNLNNTNLNDKDKTQAQAMINDKITTQGSLTKRQGIVALQEITKEQGALGRTETHLNSLEGSEDDAEARRAYAYKQAQEQNFKDLEENRQKGFRNLTSGVLDIAGEAAEGFYKGFNFGRWQTRKGRY